MKNSKSSGFTLIEIMVVIVILGVLAAVLWPKLSRGDDAKNAKIIVDDIAEINAAAKSWKGASNNYAGISITVLTAAEVLEPAWGNGAGANPVGGNYTAAPSGNNLIVTATGLTTGMCETARRRLVGSAVAVACAGGTLSVTVR